jgi:hypothetical protein
MSLAKLQEASNKPSADRRRGSKQYSQVEPSGLANRLNTSSEMNSPSATQNAGNEKPVTNYKPSLASAAMRLAFAYAFGGVAVDFDRRRRWIPVRQFAAEATNFVACKESNMTCKLDLEFPFGFAAEHDFLGHILRRISFSGLEHQRLFF